MTNVRSAKAACTRLFNQMINETKKFPQVNYREYFGKLVLEQKQSVMSLDDAIKLREIRDKAKLDLEQMRRMVNVNTLYVKNQSIIEVDDPQPKSPRKLTKRGRPRSKQ